MGRTASTLLALMLLAGAACGRKKAPSASASNADAVTENTLKMYDLHIQSYSNAKLDWDVLSPLGEMFTANNTMRLHQMTSRMYDQGQRSAEVKSDVALFATGPNSHPVDGVMLENGDAYLSKNVVMVSSDGSKVQTDWARYSKKDDLISSTAAVRVVRSDSITNGIGMEARPDMSDLKIFKQTLLIPGNDETKP